jgi:hypothetical protein
LPRGRIVCRLVLHQRRSATAIKEAGLHSFASASICGCHCPVKVWKKLDRRAIKLAGGKDTGNFDADIWGRVYLPIWAVVSKINMLKVEAGAESILTIADDDSVHEKGQEGKLVLGRVFFEEGSRVVIADGSVNGALSGYSNSRHQGDERCSEHFVSSILEK